MHSYIDDQFSRSRYEDALKEAELRRRYAQIKTEPGMLSGVIDRVRAAWAAKRSTQSAREHGAGRAGRETLATE
jgi:hypothetical protein